MAPKAPLESLAFLYLCLQKSDYKTIDFKAVAEELNLNVSAARMRFTRLKKQIDSYNAGETAGSTAVDDTISAPSTPAKSTEGKPEKSSGKTPRKAPGSTPAAKRKKVAQPKEDKAVAPKDGNEDEDESVGTQDTMQ